MELLRLENLPDSDELGILLQGYQDRAQRIVEKFLATFRDAAKKTHGLTQPEDSPFSVRVNDDPPSVQVVKKPLGGASAGIARIRQKLLPFGIPGLNFPQIITVQDADLTTEAIIVTLGDKSLKPILQNNLLMPERVAILIRILSKRFSDYFVAIKRTLLGIEHEDGTQIPFSGVPVGDSKTWDFLENLPRNICGF